MHPDPAFHWHDIVEMRDFVSHAGFGQLICATPTGLRVAHLPFVVSHDSDGETTLRFHIARSNIITPHLDGSSVLFVVNGSHGYISPDWYGIADQVPTWNYIAVELDGVVKALDNDSLIAQSDALSAANEAMLAPKAPWTRAKMDLRRFEAMLPAIQAYEMQVAEWRGTRKLNQNKPAAVRLAAADQVEAAGNAELANIMRKG